jgi:hypothetical protein
MIYGACLRACRSIGYERVYTYTLESEPGSSLKAVGFKIDGTVRADDGMGRKRYRVTRDLFGEPIRPEGEKVRWIISWK